MKKFYTIIESIIHVFRNFKRMFLLAWVTDKNLLIGYYGTSGLGAFFPILASYIYKLFIDELISTQGIATTIPVIIIALLGAKYISDIAWNFVMWGLRGTYFDFLFRYKIQNALNYQFYKKVSRLDIPHLENTDTQDLITKAKDTFTWRPPNFLRDFAHIFNNFVSFISSFLILIPFGVFAPVLVSIASLPRLFLRAKYGKLQWSIYGSGAPEVRKLWYYSWILYHKTSVIESRIFQSEKTLLKQFKKDQKYLYDLNKKPVKDFLKVAFFPQIIELALVFLFAYFKLPSVLSGEISIGDFTFFVSLLDRVTNSAADMILNFGDMYENNLYVDHYFEVLDLPKVVPDPIEPTAISKNPYPPKIEFKNVSFKYPASNNFVLENISFTIDPEENVAIVGPNGAGKTTIVKLLCRFYDVSSGEILINGINIKSADLSDWYGYLGTLFQEFMHYDFTVKENIMLGNPRIKDEKKMREAAVKSGASDFIEKLPRKYNQILGRQFEGGLELSKGQWQKLAIARAFYEEAPILILDEPTSAIDAEAEYEIFKNLKKFYNDKTLLLISHRFSTVRNADKIVVLEEGKIVGTGTHEELLSLSGLYARMFKKQAIAYQ